MAKIPDGDIGFHQQGVVVRPPKESYYAVPVHSWNQIMRRIQDCTDASSTFVSFGWGLIGIGAGAAITAVTMPLSVDFTLVTRDPQGQIISQLANTPAIAMEATLAATALGTLIGGILSLVYANRHSKDKKDMRPIIVDDMQIFAERHAAETAVASN